MEYKAKSQKVLKATLPGFLILTLLSCQPRNQDIRIIMEENSILRMELDKCKKDRKECENLLIDLL